MMKNFLLVVGFALGSACASAQECAGPHKIVVGFSAGGSGDQVARLLAEKLQTKTGLSFIVENRTGAGGNIATQFVAKAPADGCTLLVTSNNHNMNPFIYARPGYDPQKDFEPIIRVAESPSVLAVNASQPYRTLASLVEHAKATPGKLSYGSAGIGTVNHIGVEKLSRSAKIDLVHVPYKGSAAALADSVGGFTPLNNGSVAASKPFIDSGKLLPLAVGGSTRSSALPSVPTMAEAGYPDATLIVWIGLLAPSKTPVATREALNRDIRGLLADKSFRELLVARGLEPGGGTVPEYAAFMEDDFQQSRKLMKELNLKAE